MDSLVDVVGCFDAKEGFVADLLPFFLSAARESEEEAEKKLPLGSVMKGIAHLRSGLPLEPFVAYDAQCFALFHETLSSQRPWQLKLSALESLGTFLAASQFDPSDLSAHLEQLTTGKIAPPATKPDAMCAFVQVCSSALTSQSTSSFDSRH